LQSSTQFIPSQESKDGEQQIDVQPADITLEGLSTLKDTYNLSDKDSSVRKTGVNETDEALVSSLTTTIWTIIILYIRFFIITIRITKIYCLETKYTSYCCCITKYESFTNIL
jgi:hypothetical protein